MAKILVVDDRAINRDLLTTLLGYHGHRVSEATNGLEALSKAHTDPPDLIITDLLMPGMDGFEFVRNLRADAEQVNTPVIFVTATYLEPEARALADTCGPHQFVTKPFEPTRLLEIIDAALMPNDKPQPPIQDPQVLSAVRDMHLKLLQDKLVSKVEQLESLNVHLEERVRKRNLELHASNEKLRDQVAQGDLTKLELERTSAELKRSNAELRRLDEMKSNFISVAAHELRTPLTSIKNAVDLILTKKTGEITADQEQFLRMAQRNINRLAGLVSDLLTLSKIESGKFELSLTKFDLKQVIEHVLITLGPLADKKSLLLNFNYSAHLPVIRADSDKIEQVLINLISNAIKFTPAKGKINIDVLPKSSAPNSSDGVIGYVETSIADTGIGIRAEHRKHLFQQFYQVEDSLSQKKQGGTGLGLAISKGIIEAHAGRIWFESNEGMGSKFIFALPVIDEERACHALKSELTKAKLRAAPLSLLIACVSDMDGILERHKEMDARQVLSILERAIVSCRLKSTDKIEIFPLSNEVMVVAPDTDSAGAQAMLRRIKQNINKKQAEVGEFSRSLITATAAYPEDGTSDSELIDFARKEIREQTAISGVTSHG
ncbi:MAG TPA: ATP-binding protein [Candidatus Acidoferrum sp.]|nr:ATP-binding protein [Candidatus Acidoferrum sp.]